MNEIEAVDFVNYMIGVYPDEVENLVDAIEKARKIVPLVRKDVYFGAIGPHTFYSDSSESRFFQNLQPREALIILAEEMLV